MTCPQCHSGALDVTDTRLKFRGRWRRRRCMACGFRFSTMEYVVLEPKNGRPKK